MLTLSFECSAKAASCCLSRDGEIVGNCFSNVPLTHSQTLMPMMDNLLSATKTDVSEIDRIAIAAGPGSFTGVRIGISAVKGLAAPRALPCVLVSTLKAMAYMLYFEDAVICPVMDARCNQVYNALFRAKDGTVTRLCHDRALMVDELLCELESIKEKVIVVGDGADLVMKNCFLPNVVCAPQNLKIQNATGVALAAETESPVTPDELMPVYLRLPQAERELKARKK